ncbi:MULTISPECIES: hypothetical protein [unclassified Ruegeria]|uniref:hypothetical protein n=1 Tax=unclassified Ruegeria TaxID=2625375 RepID=UPI001491E2C6|nr:MULTISPECIES: hypothetical protein [unclassified Ruegeria]NOC47094.1 hypothetical protein [Ruegeria sp. HKCCD7559]NOD86082.1 hypothetical protein [Ruegeria sp. HKCCD6119]
MPQYNDMIELSVDDMDLIETALRDSIASLSHVASDEPEDSRTDREDTLRRIHELLGKLHDQKVFFRPQKGVYLGG